MKGEPAVVRNPNKKDQPVHQYVLLGQTIKEQQVPTTLGMLFLILVNIAFAIWGFYIAFRMEGSCERPLKSVVLGLAIIFVVAAILTTCMFALIRSLFFRVLMTSEEIEQSHPSVAPSSIGSSTSAASSSRRDPTVYQPLNSHEPDDPEAGANLVVVERSNAEELVRPVTDRLTCVYCSLGCLICAFLAFAIYFFTALTWILVENNDCRTAAPALYNQSKYYLIGLIVVFFIYALWLGLAFFYCTTLCQIYSIQQGIMSHLSKQHAQKSRESKRTK